MGYFWTESSGKMSLPLLFLFLIASVLPAESRQLSLTEGLSLDGSRDLKIVAVMVEFLEDTSRFTSGNGTFAAGSVPYLETPGTNIDALPHDRSYFEAHLEFAKNYFETVSHGKLVIQFEVLPDVIRLDKKMAEYSPTGPDPDISILTGLLQDVWTRVANQQNPVSFQPGDDLVFVIFHAGIGRDVELTGTSLNKTPQDIPSIYLGEDALKRYLNDPSFSGFPIQNGNILVNHSLILPRTLTRAGTDAAGNPFIVPLSINGLLAAQIGSHLGLPDLFNTETGRSGIGRFGLMDGASIFSYNGLFPPEPSAWEKAVLGWTSPFRVDTEESQEIILPAVSLRNEKSAAKVELSASEYFLIENRHRDPGGNGVTLTIKNSNGEYVEQVFTNSDVQFINQEQGFDQLLEPGVVVNVSNYDFSLPGGLISDENRERILNGGILIWHIDEASIKAGLENGTVNNHPNRKGVDLEEADGPQDIGNPVTIGLFQNSVNGSPFDFWWNGNNSSVITGSDTLQIFQNRFAPDTTPDNSSQSGSASLFELYNFSDISPVASFNIRSTDPFPDLYTQVARISVEDRFSTNQNDPYLKFFPPSIRGVDSDEKTRFLIPGREKIWMFDSEGDVEFTVDHSLGSLQQPFYDPENRWLAIAESPGETDETIQLKAYRIGLDSVDEIIRAETASTKAFLSSQSGTLLEIDGTANRFNLSTGDSFKLDRAVQESEVIGSYRSRIEENQLILEFPGGERTFDLTGQPDSKRSYTGVISEGSEVFFYLLTDSELTLFSPENDYAEKETIVQSKQMGWPSMADFNSDGMIDFIYLDLSENRLIGINRAGSLLPSFPISPPDEVILTGTPLVADLDGDSQPDLIVQGSTPSSTNLYAYNHEGELKQGFPLLAGSNEDANESPILPVIAGDYIAAASPGGRLNIWHFPAMDEVQWSSAYGNNMFNKVTGRTQSGEIPVRDFSLLNASETYNWPNPARDETVIRYQTSEPAAISIKIMTPSGRVLEQIRFQSQTSLPSEYRIDTSTWASGAYFAMVEARSNGKSERKLVKIAIVR